MVLSKRKRYRSGEVIFREGSFGQCAYIIESGQVEIRLEGSDGDVCLNTLGIGEIFGEMAVIDGSPRSASAIASEPCDLVIVSREAISERIDSADPIVRLLISMLLKRMRITNKSAQGAQKSVSKVSEGNPLTLDLITNDDISDQKQQVLEKMRIESDLKQALQNDEFRLHFQPIFDLNLNTVSGFEALIRWNSLSRGTVRPDIFMAIAEETSLIVPIGRWVIENSCAALKRFVAEAKKYGIKETPMIAINISGRQFNDPKFFDHLVSVVDKNKLPHSNVKLEVTERIFMEGPGALRAIMKARNLGFPVALDDFGTGYSSLSYLANFEVDTLKIDQSFVRTMLQDHKTKAIVEAVIQIANGLKVPVVAEGIEDEQVCKVLGEMKCNYGQGYFFSQPLSIEDAIKFMRDSACVKSVS